MRCSRAGLLMQVLIAAVGLAAWRAHATPAPRVWHATILERNQGQAPRRIDYIARSGEYTTYIAAGSMHVVSVPPASTGGFDAEIRLLHINPRSKARGYDALPTRVSYFLGREKSDWHAAIPTFAGVEYREIYPGVDLRYHANGVNLEYDFIVAPGADSRLVAMEFLGPAKPKLDSSGELELRGAHERAPLDHKLVTYQIINGVRKDIPSRFVLADRRVSFDVSAYDRRQPLVIDPVVVRSVRWGGSSSDAAWSVATDKSGNVYVTGDTNSVDLPQIHSRRRGPHGSTDIFVAKFDPSGSKLLYETYLGGSGNDVGYGIAADDQGNIYVTGDTDSHDFPTMKPWQPAFGGDADVFVTKISADGSRLIYSSYVGGANGERGTGIAVDHDGYAYVAGYTHSMDFPTVRPLQRDFAGGNADAFVFKVKQDGSGLVYSTYLGGGNDRPDFATAVATDGKGNAYVTGFTNSADFPSMHPLQRFIGPTDAFVTKLNPDGSELVYSTWLGGGADDEAMSITVDSSGSAYVTGETESPDFPTTKGAYSTKCTAIDGQIRIGKICSGGDLFVSKLSPDGSSLVYSTYVNGTKFEVGRGIAVDPEGNAYVTGITGSEDFPTIEAPQTKFGGGDYDAFVLKLNPTGSALIYSTYVGGGANDAGYGIAVDGNGIAHAVGYTESLDFPAASISAHPSIGSTDAFMATIPSALPRPVP